MKYSFLIALVCLFLATACNKDKFKTEPQVEIKSISPSTVRTNDIITMRSKYTDDEGDIDTIFLVYKWYNGVAVAFEDTIRFPFSFLRVPNKTREADLNIIVAYDLRFPSQDLVSLSAVPRDTTASFGIVLKDKAGHRSNYGEWDKIRLKKP